jgi:hypothetical protein
LPKCSRVSSDAAHFETIAALRNAEDDNLDQAQLLASDALGKSQDRVILIYAALTFARVGRTEQAQELVEEVSQRFSDEFSVQAFLLPRVRAAITFREKTIRCTHNTATDGALRSRLQQRFSICISCVLARPRVSPVEVRAVGGRSVPKGSRSFRDRERFRNGQSFYSAVRACSGPQSAVNPHSGAGVNPQPHLQNGKVRSIVLRRFLCAAMPEDCVFGTSRQGLAAPKCCRKVVRLRLTWTLQIAALNRLSPAAVT